MRGAKTVAICMLPLLSCGCATWSTSSVEPSASLVESTSSNLSEEELATQSEAILITTDDITDKAYRTLGDIKVTVNKTTIFHPDPTQEDVNKKLREEAAKLNADAVILVRYGTVGLSLVSWGSLDGRGRAVVFTE